MLKAGIVTKEEEFNQLEYTRDDFRQTECKNIKALEQK